MEIHTRDALLVRSEHAGDHLGITDARRAFVMDHEVVALCIIGVAVNRNRWLSAFIRRMCMIDLDINPALEPLLQDVLLLCVIMAATARDKQRPQRFGQRFLVIRRIKICSQQAVNHQEVKKIFHD